MFALIRAFLRLCFGFRTFNDRVLDTPGPVLLIPNHVSWLDWLFVGACLDSDWKFVTSQTTANRNWLFRTIMINSRTFPIDTASPYAVKRMAEYLEKGGRLVLFAEGRLSETGSLMKIFEGTGFLLYKTGAKVITCYLRGAERLKLAKHPGWREWFPPVSAHFSALQTPPKIESLGTTQARKKLTNWLRDFMLEERFRVEMEHGAPTLTEALATMVRRRGSQVILEDVTFQPLTYRRFWLAAELLGKAVAPLVGPARHVGVLLPNVNSTPVTLLACWQRGQVPVVFNYTAGTATMLVCAQLAEVRHILTSRLFVERSKIDVAAFQQAGIEIVYLEDVGARISGTAKFLGLLRLLLLGPHPHAGHANDPAAILFTSGSENMPKAVVLTHRNCLANIRQLLVVTDLQDSDRCFTALPLFHSFGLTVGLLLPLVRGIYTLLYLSPLHYRVVPGIVYDRNCTIMLATNTFLNGYARKAHPYDFRSIRYLFAGAEKLQEPTATTWAQQFGVRVLEGYGATECSPVISCCSPLTPKHGTAGRLLPGIEYRIEPVPGIEDGGKLLIKGPNVMQGYLNPEPNAKFQALGGWYDTGDIVHVDEERFIHIRGRQKRFAKVSGEMVSLSAVEEALAAAFPKYGLRHCVAVLARPDEKRGESLVAVSNDERLTIEEIREVIKAKGLSNLAVPREIRFLRNIPRLGTGKVDYRELDKVMAKENATP